MKQIAARMTTRRNSSIRGGLRIAVTLALVLTAAVVVPSAGGGDRQDVSYVGQLVNYNRPNDIRFSVERRGGENVRALFEARDIPLVCENDTGPDIDFPPRSFRFLGPRVFQGQHYERQPNGDFSYYEVKGRLRSGGRATGYLYYLDEPYDPRGTEERVECSTGGQLYIQWSAQRR